MPSTENTETREYELRHHMTLGQMQSFAQRLTGLIGTDSELSELSRELFGEQEV